MCLEYLRASFSACHCEPVWCSAQRIKIIITAGGSYTIIHAHWRGPFQGFPLATIRFLLMQVELRAEDEGFDCRSAGRRNVRWQPVFELAAPSAHRALGFRWVRIPHDWIKKSGYPKGYPDFLAEDEGFEPPQTESESGVLPLHKSSICDPGPHGGDNRTRTCDLMRVKHAL